MGLQVMRQMSNDRANCRFLGHFPGGATVTIVSWHVLGPIVMCVYIVPEEGQFGYPFFLSISMFFKL